MTLKYIVKLTFFHIEILCWNFDCLLAKVCQFPDHIFPCFSKYIQEYIFRNEKNSDILLEKKTIQFIRRKMKIV